MIVLRDDTTAYHDRRQTAEFFSPRRGKRHRRLRGRKGEAMVQSLARKAVGRGAERSGDVSRRNGRLSGVKVVRVTSVDLNLNLKRRFASDEGLPHRIGQDSFMWREMFVVAISLEHRGHGPLAPLWTRACTGEFTRHVALCFL